MGFYQLRNHTCTCIPSANTVFNNNNIEVYLPGRLDVHFRRHVEQNVLFT